MHANLSGPSCLEITINDVTYPLVEVRETANNTLLLTFESRNYSMYGYDASPSCPLRVVINGATCVFTGEYDASTVRAPMSGKLVRYTVPDGAPVTRGQLFAEMEVGIFG